LVQRVDLKRRRFGTDGQRVNADSRASDLSVERTSNAPEERATTSPTLASEEETLETTELRRLADIDDVTQVLNRRALLTRLDAAVARHRHTADKLAVVLVKLDDFAEFTHAAGDSLSALILANIASRLTASTREGETVAYLGGDRFVVVLDPVSDRTDAITGAERIRRAINVPIVFGRREFSITASLGVAFNGRRTETAVELLVDADVAARSAQLRGQNDWAIFDDELRTRMTSDLRVEDAIDEALRLDRITVEYQPVVDSLTRRAVGFEALARFRNADGTLTLPGTFLPVAEATGRNKAIDLAVLDQACNEARRIGNLTSDERITVSVNLAVSTALRPDLHSIILEAAEDHGVSPSRLVLEFSEATLLRAGTATRAAFAELREDGVGLVVDSYGVGPVGLSFVGRFAVSAIKVDGGVVRAAASSANDRALLRAIVAQAHALGLEVTAKGVETSVLADTLTEIGCDRLQGYLFGHPMSGPDAELHLQM
jgi:diguanylate cyclase (GGDEF)-like protein